MDDATAMELEFVLARTSAAVAHRLPRCYGLSSDALAFFALGKRDEPTEWDYPMDPSDLAACQMTYDMAPAHLKPVMLPVLAKMRGYVAERYPEVLAWIATT